MQRTDSHVCEGKLYDISNFAGYQGEKIREVTTQTLVCNLCWNRIKDDMLALEVARKKANLALWSKALS